MYLLAKVLNPGLSYMYPDICHKQENQLLEHQDKYHQIHENLMKKVY